MRPSEPVSTPPREPRRRPAPPRGGPSPAPADRAMIERLRAAGLRPTRQRIELGRVLFAEGDRHLSAEAVYDEAIRADVAVSLATVYNTLKQFTEAGLLRELAVVGAKSFFDTRVGDHHHFFVEGEDRMIDVEAHEVDVGRLPEPPSGFEIAGYDVVVRLRRRGASARCE